MQILTTSAKPRIDKCEKGDSPLFHIFRDNDLTFKELLYNRNET